MTLETIRIHIRLARHDLGRDPHAKLPRGRAALEATLRLLRIEQSNSARSNLRDDIKAQIRNRGQRDAA